MRFVVIYLNFTDLFIFIGFRNVRLTNEYSEELEMSSILLKVAIAKEGKM